MSDDTMKYTMILVLLLGVSGFSCLLRAQKMVLRQSNENGIYHSGDRVRIDLSCKEPFSDSLVLSIRKNFQAPYRVENLLCPVAEKIIFDETVQGPATMMVQLTSLKDTVATGLIIDPEK